MVKAAGPSPPWILVYTILTIGMIKDETATLAAREMQTAEFSASDRLYF